MLKWISAQGKYRKEIAENKSFVAEGKFTKSSPKYVFVDELLSQFLTLCSNNREVAGSMQDSILQAGSAAAQLELPSCRCPQRQKASPEVCLTAPVHLQGVCGRGNPLSPTWKVSKARELHT